MPGGRRGECHRPGGTSGTPRLQARGYPARRRPCEPLEDRERERLLLSLRRGRPFGDDKWTARAADRLGLAHTLRPRGRPRKPPQPAASSPRTKGAGRPKM